MNMNGFMLIRIEIKDKSKVFKYLRHIVFVFCLQNYYFFFKLPKKYFMNEKKYLLCTPTYYS